MWKEDKRNNEILKQRQDTEIAKMFRMRQHADQFV
jgi:hypothetical protein